MEVSKFIVGVLTIAISLLFLGYLARGVVFVAQKANQGIVDHERFKLKKLNEELYK